MFLSRFHSASIFFLLIPLSFFCLYVCSVHAADTSLSVCNASGDQKPIYMHFYGKLNLHITCHTDCQQNYTITIFPDAQSIDTRAHVKIEHIFKSQQWRLASEEHWGRAIFSVAQLERLHELWCISRLMNEADWVGLKEIVKVGIKRYTQALEEK